MKRNYALNQVLQSTHPPNTFIRILPNRKRLSKIGALIPVSWQAYISKIWILRAKDRVFYFARYCLWEWCPAPRTGAGLASGTHLCDTATYSLEVASNTLIVHEAHFEIPPSISLPSLSEMKLLLSLHRVRIGKFHFTQVPISELCWLWQSQRWITISAPKHRIVLLPLRRFYLQYLSTPAARIVHFCNQNLPLARLQMIPHGYAPKFNPVHHIRLL